MLAFTNTERSRAAHVAALVVILTAGAVSAAWAFLVPIFQAPDEPAHFDYAISIYDAHRLIRLSDGRPDWIVSPYTQYLLKATDFDRIARHSSMHVPDGYGTTAYFATLDAGAPTLRDRQPSTGKINYIVALYPFGFYALEAMWLHTITLFTSSLAVSFFAARFLCIFLTMVGLYFNYRTALNLGLPPWIGVALVGAIGLLPLTSFVSSSVQPDNLGYALVSAALFLATQARSGVSLTIAATLGLTLGFLAITKYHFFAPVAIAVWLLMIGLILPAATTLKRLALAALLVLPSVLLLTVQIFSVDQSGAAANVASKLQVGPLLTVMAHGVPATLRYATSESGAAFVDCFVSGICAATFWQPGGWADVPMVIFNPTAQTWLRVGISLLTIAVAVVLVLFLAKNAGRLIRAAVRGHARSAYGIATADPVINSYLLFVGVMFGLYVITQNGYGASGRHWYAFLFPALLCFVWYAPRALAKRNVRLSGILACVLAGYAAVACVYALSDLKHRYYGPQSASYVAASPGAAEIAPGTASGVLWPIEEVGYFMNASNAVFSFPSGARLRITGAAIPQRPSSPTDVALILDGTKPLPVLAGQYLVGIAEAMHSSALGFSGFTADVAASQLSEGPHTVAAYARIAGTRTYQPILPRRTFFITQDDGSFSTSFLYELQHATTVGGSFRELEACRGSVNAYEQIPTVTSGSILLLQGESGSLSTRRNSDVWLLVDGRPYPARLDAAAHEFAGTIPTARLQYGDHRVSVFETAMQPPRYTQVGRGAEFRIVPKGNVAMTLADPPQACADPLQLMLAS